MTEGTALTTETTHIDVTSETFETHVIQESHKRPVVVDFWAEWCAPCRMLGPTLEGLADEDGGEWLLAKLDVETNQELSGQFQIRGIPAVKAFVDGEEVASFVGALPAPQIRQWLKGFVPTKADKLMLQASEAMQNDNQSLAGELIDKALELEPRHSFALLLLARLALNEGELDKARAALAEIPLVDRDRLAQEIAQLEFELRGEGAGGGMEEAQAAVDAEPDNLALRMTLGEALAAEHKYEEAMEAYLHVIKKGDSDEKESARAAMVSLFDAAGFHSDATRKYRSLLSQYLYS